MGSNPPKKGAEGFLQCSHPNCKFRTRWEFNLARHARVHDPKLVQYFQCPACRKNFGFKCNLLRHLEGVHPGFNFSPSLLLPQSGSPSSSSTDLQLQNGPNEGGGGRKLKKGKGKLSKKRTGFSCSECDFESALEVDLKGHAATSHHHQTNVKFYHCSFPDCGFQSKWSQNVKEHEKRLHGGKLNLNFQQQQEQNNANATGLSGGGSRSSDLTGQKFKCSQCGTHFASRCNLSRHLRTSLCLQNLKKWNPSVQENMSSREVSQEKIDWEECHFCKYVQRLGTYLQKHMRTCPGCHRTLTPTPYSVSLNNF